MPAKSKSRAKNVPVEVPLVVEEQKSPRLEDMDVTEPPAKRMKQGDTIWNLMKDQQVWIGRYNGGGESNSKIAAFDFDGTLSVPKSGAKFPKDAKDFKLWNPKLQDLINGLKDHRFVIISNQLGVTVGGAKLPDVQGRMEGILRELGDKPCLILLAIGENLYRKPRPGMFDVLQKELNGGIEIDLKTSFYVGDAAGRKNKTTKDHSAADLCFALNIGIPFLTPEQFLAGNAIEPTSEMDMKAYTLPKFDPRPVKNITKFGIEQVTKKVINDATDLSDTLTKLFKKHDKIIIVSGGLPGSGKSTLFKNHLEPLGFKKISRDELKTMDKCEREVKRIIAEGKKNIRLVVDNTNYEAKTRQRWAALAKELGAFVVAVWMNVDKEHAIHNNLFRKALNHLPNVKEGDEKIPSVPSMVIYKQAKEMSLPTAKEGFAAVFNINFVPVFTNPEHERIYYMFLTDK